MKRHFVTFLSPGTLISEQTTKPIDKWDPAVAYDMAEDIVERHGAKPYAFYFTTRERRDDELDSREVERSPHYWLGGEVRTRDEVLAGTDPDEKVLRDDLRNNSHYKRVIINTNSFLVTMPMEDDDVVISKGLGNQIIIH